MPVFVLTDDALHVQPLHPKFERVVAIFGTLGFSFHTDAPAATAQLDAKRAGRMLLGNFEPTHPFESRQSVRNATHDEVLGLTKYCFPLEDLRRIEVGERFPDLTIEIRGPGGLRRESYDLTPELPRAVPGPATDEMRAYGRAVAALLDAADERDWPGERSTGWLDLPAIEWEPADFPGQEENALPTYRSAPAAQKRILAERGPGGIFEALARATIPRAMSSPRRVVVTAEDIFAEFSRMGVYRLPRGLPRWTDGRDVVFGRYARMRLEPRDATCPVAAMLIGARE